MSILCKFAAWLQELACCKSASRKLVVARVVDLDTGFTVEGEATKVKITDSQQASISWGKPVDKKGRPAKVQDGSVKIVCSDDSVTVEQDANDPFTAIVKGVHENEDVGAVLTISADADLGDGVTEITGTEPLVVTAGPAVGFGPANVGTPEEQP